MRAFIATGRIVNHNGVNMTVPTTVDRWIWASMSSIRYLTHYSATVSIVLGAASADPATIATAIIIIARHTDTTTADMRCPTVGCNRP